MRTIHNIKLYTENLLNIQAAADQAGGSFRPLLLKQDVVDFLGCIANNSIKLNPAFIREECEELKDILKPRELWKKDI